MKQDICTVFDIGKGAYKAIIFNINFECIEERTTVPQAILDGDGFRGEDANELKKWLLATFDELRKSTTYNLKAVNFTSYAGGMVHLDKHGNPVTPIFDVVKNLPYAVEKQFRERVLAKYNLCAATESPYLGIMNAGVQLFWLKHSQPDLYEQVAMSLFLPQYGHFLLTGQLTTEVSSLDCHSMLWDSATTDYQTWLTEHGIRDKLPPVAELTSVQPAQQDPRIQVGVGMQNTLSSLMLYENSVEPFVLSSSKAWTVNSNPFAKKRLTDKSLDAHTFAFKTANNRSVHASRVFSGNEHARQVKYLADYFGKPLDFYKQVAYDVNLIWQLRERFQQATPDTTDSRLLLDCAFVERNINQFKSYEEAYHQFILDLVAQEVASLKLVLGYSKTRKIIIEGDFVGNKIYLELLNEAFFDKLIYVNENFCSGATGAALVLAKHWTPTPPDGVVVKLRQI